MHPYAYYFKLSITQHIVISSQQLINCLDLYVRQECLSRNIPDEIRCVTYHITV